MVEQATLDSQTSWPAEIRDKATFHVGDCTKPLSIPKSNNTNGGEGGDDGLYAEGGEGDGTPLLLSTNRLFSKWAPWGLRVDLAHYKICSINRGLEVADRHI